MIWRIRSKRVFRQLNTDGRRAKSGPVRMTYVPLATDRPQLAMAFGRRFGNAAERNRARRRVRHAFADAWSRAVGDDGTPLEGAFLVNGHRGLLTMPYEAIVDAIGRCFDALASPPIKPCRS